jgi:TRAP-type C4-dicarboxylate transport system permease small subunit
MQPAPGKQRKPRIPGSERFSIVSLGLAAAGKRNNFAEDLVKINNILNRLEKFNYRLSVWLERIAILAVVGMILGTMIDVVGAKLFHWPLPAGIEAVYLLQVIAIAGALAISKIDGRHVRIEMIDRLPQPAIGIIHSLVAFLGLALFILLCWQSFDYAQSLRTNHEVTATAKIAIYPFALWLAVCCIPMVLILFKEFVSSLLETIRR